MDKKTYIIYMHINNINNKKYIGQTSQQNPNVRWANGKGYKGNEHFYRAINKYGWDNFEHKILFTNLSLEEANKKEIELIKKYNTLDEKFGYNNKEGGSNGGHTEETKQKISKNHSRWNKGKHHTQEQIEKLKLSWIKRKESGFEAYFKGKHLAEETKEKLRQVNLGKTLSEETKNKISNSNKGKTKVFTEEHKKNIGLSSKGRKWTENQRKAITEGHKQRRWINKDGKNKFIKNTDLQQFLDSGWSLGMDYIFTEEMRLKRSKNAKKRRMSK